MIPRYNIKRIKNRLNTSGLTYAPPRLDLPALPPALPFTIDELKIWVYPTDNYDWSVAGEEGFAQEVLAFRDEVQEVLSKYVKELLEFSLPYKLTGDEFISGGIISVPISFTIDKLGLRRLFTVFGKIHPDFEWEMEFSNSDGDWKFFDAGEQIYVRIGNGDYESLFPVQLGNIRDNKRRNNKIAKKVSQLLAVDKIYEANGSIRFQLGDSYLIGVPKSLYVSPENTYFSITDFHIPSARRGTGDAEILLDRLTREFSPISAQIDASEASIKLFIDAGFTDIHDSTLSEALKIYENQGETINLRTDWQPFRDRS